MNPLIVLGNGQSLSKIDLSKLNNEDTFALNGAYLKFQELNWFPKYFGVFPRGPNHWKWEDINNFLLENKSKFDKFFFFEWDKPSITIPITDKIIFLQSHLPNNINIDMSQWSLPLTVEIGIALDHRNLELKKEGYKKPNIELKMWQDNHYLMRYKNVQKIKKLNHVGILKLIKNETLIENDYIKLPRFKESWILPKSFKDFSFSGGNAGVIACLIGYLLGYKKIILLGMDSKWTIKDNIVDTNKSYWYSNYFNNEDYNVKEFCKSCDAESIQKMQMDSWLNLKEMFEANNIDINIVNCTEGSALEYFRKSSLEKEI